MVTELRNDNPEPQTVIFTITYEYIPYRPSGFDSLASIWLDIHGCDRHEVPFPANEKSFSFFSPVWESTMNARILIAGGHLHNGGTQIDLRKNNGTICSLVAKYDDGGRMGHISEMSHIGRIEVGDKWNIRVDYDVMAHPPMMEASSKVEDAGGLAVMYVIES